MLKTVNREIMMANQDKPEEIQKELVPNLKFPNQEVLENEELKRQRIYNILRATRLGNGAKIKVKIIFEDANGMKMVNTTIWGATPNFIILKRGVTIPICRIHDVSLF